LPLWLNSHAKEYILKHHKGLQFISAVKRVIFLNQLTKGNKQMKKRGRKRLNVSMVVIWMGMKGRCVVIV